MGCFIVPATEAIVTTVITKVAEKKETKVSEEAKLNLEKFTTRMKRLNKLLWGGSALLAFEHVWHGEVTAFFPFLTAAENPADLMQMFKEMSTTGVAMALLVTAVWGISNVVIDAIDKKKVEVKA